MSANVSNLVLLSGQMALAQAMDVVANNIANVNTTGFKREGIAFDSYVKKAGTSEKPAADFVYDHTTYRDTSSGPIVNTGNPLDLAINGKGYFKVQMPDGSTGYTRDGVFQLDPNGQIVTQAGRPVLGDGGPIIIPPTASQVNIASDGFVTTRVDNGSALAQLGKIKLADFDDEQKLDPAGSSLYTSTQQPTEDTTSSIKQGSIEQSNVQAVTEITNMISIMRSYEQASNMISSENQRQSDAVSRLSKTTTGS